MTYILDLDLYNLSFITHKSNSVYGTTENFLNRVAQKSFFMKDITKLNLINKYLRNNLQKSRFLMSRT